MVHIFLTGATGYVGGQALYQIFQRSSDARPSVAALARNATKEAQLLKAYPEIRVVRGDLDNVELIEQEATRADVVLHLASTNHLPSSLAIARGLSTKGRNQPGYWVQMSGASMLCVPDIESGSYGEYREAIYDDIKDIEEVKSIITCNPKRVVDQLVLAQDPTQVKTALIVGGLIYGVGQGPCNTRSIQLPNLARHILKTGEGFRVGAGQSVWSNIHVADLGHLLDLLLEAATAQKQGHWNDAGIYMPENGKMAFGELSRLVTLAAYDQGHIGSPSVGKSINADEANKIMPGGAIFWATNAMMVASREKNDLAWRPFANSLEDEVPRAVKIEAASSQ